MEVKWSPDQVEGGEYAREKERHTGATFPLTPQAGSHIIIFKICMISSANRAKQ